MEERKRSARRLDALVHASDIHDEFVRRSIDRVRVPTRACGPTDRAADDILITAPHAFCEAADATRAEVRDPWSGTLADAIAGALSSDGLRTRVIPASMHRRHGDQNRLNGLYTCGDMAPRLRRWRLSHDMRRTLHLDVHTFTQDRPLAGWGRGLNVVVLADAPDQLALAREFAAAFDSSVAEKERQLPCLPPTTVVVMSRRPTHEEDSESNAIVEWAHSFGARTLLLEFPTRPLSCAGGKAATCALDECWCTAWPLSDLVDAARHAVRVACGPTPVVARGREAVGGRRDGLVRCARRH